jgi:hypothetical protein
MSYGCLALAGSRAQGAMPLPWSLKSVAIGIDHFSLVAVFEVAAVDIVTGRSCRPPWTRAMARLVNSPSSPVRSRGRQPG